MTPKLAPPKLTEAQFQAQVIQLARLFGWREYHTHDSRRSQPGLPDLLLAKRGRPVIFAELKTDSGQTTPAQDEWLELLRSTGARVFLWRPGMWDEITRELQS